MLVLPAKSVAFRTASTEASLKAAPSASVWTAAKRRNGTTRWDDKIFVGFSGDRHRIAEVVRIDANSELVYCATLRYNLALNWCEKNLREVYD